MKRILRGICIVLVGIAATTTSGVRPAHADSSNAAYVAQGINLDNVCFPLSDGSTMCQTWHVSVAVVTTLSGVNTWVENGTIDYTLYDSQGTLVTTFTQTLHQHVLTLDEFQELNARMTYTDENGCTVTEMVHFVNGQWQIYNVTYTCA